MPLCSTGSGSGTLGAGRVTGRRVAEDKATALNDLADRTPASFTPTRPAGDKPRRGLSRAAGVALGLAALAGVGALAAFPGGGAPAAPQLVAGPVHAGPIPPQVVFSSPDSGFSFSSDCVHAQPGDE